MSKFHINGKGVPAPCRAQKGNCPFGGEDSHFDSKEEAQVVANKRNSEAHNILPGVNGKSEEYNKMKDNMLNGNIYAVEKDMHYLKAEDVEGAYEIIRDIERKGDLKREKNMLAHERNFLFQQHSEKGEQILSDLHRNSEEGQKLRELEMKEMELSDKIDELNEQVKENNSGSCPKCGKGKMMERNSKNGTFIGCSNFPNCKHTQKKLKLNSSFQKRMEKLQYDNKIIHQSLSREVNDLQKEDPESQKLQTKIDELSNKIKIIDYIEEHKRKTETGETPIQKYYKERRIAVAQIKKKIGDNKLVLNSGKMTYGHQNKIDADLKVNKDENIDNLYLENQSKPGELKKVKEIKDGSLILDNDEKVRFMHATNWNMRNSINDKPGNGWKMYTSKSSGEDYEGSVDLSYSNIDSSD